MLEASVPRLISVEGVTMPDKRFTTKTCQTNKAHGINRKHGQDKAILPTTDLSVSYFVTSTKIHFPILDFVMRLRNGTKNLLNLYRRHHINNRTQFGESQRI